jgi:cyclic-di-GMP phosphodiesterase, flagellum assembly factor TipF
MTRQLAKPQPLYARFGDAFVILSVTLLSLASGAWLITSIGLELTSAMLASLATYGILLLLHLLVRRSLADAEDDDDDDLLYGDSHWQTAQPGEPFEAALVRTSANSAPPAKSGARPPPRSQPGVWPEPLPMPVPAADLGADQGSPEPDPFTFRPSRTPYFADPSDFDPLALGAAPGKEQAPEASLLPPEMPEVNVEYIQELIKKLADELNGEPSPEAANPGREAATATAPGERADAMIGRSVAALETTARTMRGDSAGAHAGLGSTGLGSTGLGSAGPGLGVSPPPWRPATLSPGRQGAPPLLDPQLARIAEAVAAERMEVLLEPIQGLSEGRARHYEVSIRLRTADGSALEQSDFSRLAQGSGLMPRLDAARMMRAARVARRLSERGVHASVLTGAAGESLADEEFLDAVALQPGTDGRISLVLSFAQSDVRTFTPVHAEALGSMAASGFGFALEDVTDLDMDFGGLKAMGFEFVKLDAQVFLDGLQAPSGRVPASDICRYLSEFGLAVIVGRIEDDWLLARILGFGVLLGKGTLFGGAKLVKAEVVADRGSAAA